MYFYGSNLGPLALAILDPGTFIANGSEFETVTISDIDAKYTTLARIRKP